MQQKCALGSFSVAACDVQCERAPGAGLPARAPSVISSFRHRPCPTSLYLQGTQRRSRRDFHLKACERWTMRAMEVDGRSWPAAAGGCAPVSDGCSYVGDLVHL